MDEAIPPSMALLAVAASLIIVRVFGALAAEFLTPLFATPVGLGALMASAELLVAAVPLAYMVHRGIDVKGYVGFRADLKKAMLGAGLGFLLLFLDTFASYVLTTIFGPSEAVEESNRAIAALAATPEGLTMVAASLILAGVCEEFTFRGFLQNSLNSKFSFKTALLISSLMFGLAHFDPQLVYTVSAFLLGLALGYVYRRWSYTAAATAHATLNLIVLALLTL